jgi:phosphopantothenoylcysteine decarboxylase/phosphopantothenate--cysteine ligase
VSDAGVEDWPTLAKEEVAQRLAERVARHLGTARAAQAAE